MKAWLAVAQIILAFLFAAAPHGRAEEPAAAADSAIEARPIGGVDARTATLLLSGQQSGDVDGAVAWIVGAPGTDGRCRVPFIVEVDGASLLPERPASRIAIGFFAYLIDSDGEVADHISQGVVLDSGLWAERIADGGLRFAGHTVLEPGSYILSVVARARGSKRLFLARRQLFVRGGPSPESFDLAPVFTDPGGGWLNLRQAGMPEGLAPIAGDGIEPAARPVLVEGRETEFFLVNDVEATPPIDARFVDRAGRVLAEYTVKVEPPSAERPRLARAKLPAVDLPTGAYSLVLEARAANGAVRYSTPAVLVASDGPVTWIADRGAADGAVGANEAAGTSPEAKFRRRRARAAYLEVLRLLASGDGGAARGKLLEIERTAAAHEVLRASRRIEDSVANRLAATDPDALLQVALLHHQMVRRYVARNEFVLSAYSRSVAADRAAQIASSGGNTRFAAALLVNIAADMARTAAPALAIEYLEKALALEPSFRPALLALGSIYERSADYEAAASLFEKLVETHPAHLEGRLRLATNLARTGSTRQAGAHFRSLLDGDAPSWIHALATQEYAQMLVREGEAEKAFELASRQAPALPNDQRLMVLLAYLADGAARPMESVEYILHIPDAQSGISPRARYTEWPDLGSEASALALRAAAAESLPAFAHALERLGVPE